MKQYQLIKLIEIINETRNRRLQLPTHWTIDEIRYLPVPDEGRNEDDCDGVGGGGSK